MERSSRYGERDYAFGQLMLTLRTALGLTQEGLAQLLQLNRRAVAGWEGGDSYPKADHLQPFIALCVHHQAFAGGRQEEEIRALWKAAHQKVLLDEAWLQELLASPRSVQLSPPAATPLAHAGAKPATSSRVDWDDALDVPTFYGREGELALLSRWVVQERCRVVSVLGMGGIGKSALAMTVMHQVARQFEVVIWRSLRDAPACSALLAACKCLPRNCCRICRIPSKAAFIS